MSVAWETITVKSNVSGTEQSGVRAGDEWNSHREMLFNKIDGGIQTNLLSSGSCWQLTYLTLNTAHCLISRDTAPQIVFGGLREETAKKYFSGFILRLNFDSFLQPSYVTFIYQLNNRALLFRLSVFFHRLTNWKEKSQKRVKIGNQS